MNRTDFATDDAYIEYLENCVEVLDGSNTLLSALVGRVGQHAEEYSDHRRQYGSSAFPYVAFPHDEFLEVILRLRSLWVNCRKTNPSFLDVGCGIADKVELAAYAGFVAHGIEFDTYLLRRAKRLFGITDCRDSDASAKQADALKYTDYSKFDVIYFYRPIAEIELQRKLERRIYRQAKLGAYLIPAFCCNKPPLTDYDLIETYPHLTHGVMVYRRVRKGRVNWRKGRIMRVKRVTTNKDKR